MDWEAIGTIVALIGVVVTFIFNIRSNRITRDGQEQERALAENTAARAEQATRVSYDYAERVIDALEQIAAAGGGTLGGAPAARVGWSLVHDRGDTYRLTNEGDLTARDVQIGTHESMRTAHVVGGPDLASGEALTFMASVSMQTSDTTVTVTWSEQGSDDRKTWRYPLPARPTR